LHDKRRNLSVIMYMKHGGVIAYIALLRMHGVRRNKNWNIL